MLDPSLANLWPASFTPQHSLLLLEQTPCFHSLNTTDLLFKLIKALNQDGYHGNGGFHHDTIGIGTSSSSMLNTDPTYNLRKLTEESSGSSFALDVSLVIVCIVCAGLASGLTQGLLSLDFTEMTIKSRSGTVDEKKYAAKVLPIISRHHLLLVSLMLWNAAATEALPIFLSALVPEYLAIIISVTLVLFVGEIIPASILTGPNQLLIAANLTPMVYLVLLFFYPIAYPISCILDYLLGPLFLLLFLFLSVECSLRVTLSLALSLALYFSLLFSSLLFLFLSVEFSLCIMCTIICFDIPSRVMHNDSQSNFHVLSVLLQNIVCLCAENLPLFLFLLHFHLHCVLHSCRS